VGPEQLAPRERVELADRNAQLENSRRKREGSGVEAAASSRYGTRVNPNSSHRGFNDLEGYEQEVWIDPSRNLDQALENPRNRRRGGDNSSTNGAEATPTEAELKTAVLFETAGGLGAKLRNTHLVGGERVKELDFFVASVSVLVGTFVCARTYYHDFVYFIGRNLRLFSNANNVSLFVGSNTESLLIAFLLFGIMRTHVGGNPYRSSAAARPRNCRGSNGSASSCAHASG
jgi:hypothetical protein